MIWLKCPGKLQILSYWLRYWLLYYYFVGIYVNYRPLWVINDTIPLNNYLNITLI